jgi:hypothetical protein
MTIPNFGRLNGVSAADFDAVFNAFTNKSESSPLNQYNNDSADLKLARSMVEEQINVSGAEVVVFARTDNGDFDSVWDEDADPTYLNPKMMKAFYKPEQIQSELTRWGVDTKIKLDVSFAYTHILREFGERLLRPGDVIQIPYNSLNINPVNFRVLNASPLGNHRFNWLFWQCNVEQLTADITVRVTDDMPVDMEVDSNGVYRESL